MEAYLVASVIGTVVSFLTWTTIGVIYWDYRMPPSPAIELSLACGAGVMVGLVAMLVSFIGWRSQSRSIRQDMRRP